MGAKVKTSGGRLVALERRPFVHSLTPVVYVLTCLILCLGCMNDALQEQVEPPESASTVSVSMRG